MLLRPWSAEDLPDGLMAFADPSVLRFSWVSSAPFTEADARAFFTAQAEAHARGEEVQLAIVDPSAPATVLGSVSLYEVDLARGRAMLGYWLTSAARGRGRASEATRLLAGWGFERLGLSRVALTCGPDNRDSQRVAERCGFTREGVLRSHMPFKGGRRDSVVYGLLPGELR